MNKRSILITILAILTFNPLSFAQKPMDGLWNFLYLQVGKEKTKTCDMLNTEPLDFFILDLYPDGLYSSTSGCRVWYGMGKGHIATIRK